MSSADDALDAALGREAAAQAALTDLLAGKRELIDKAKALVQAVALAAETAATGAATSAGLPLGGLIHGATQKLVDVATRELDSHRPSG